MKRLVKYIVLVMCSGFVMASCSQKHDTSNGTNEVVGLLAKAVESKKILFGQQDFAFYGVSWFGEEGRADVKDVCGDYPAILGCDLGELELGGDKNLDGVPFEMMHREIVAQHARGGLIAISWHVRNPKTGGDSWDISDNQTVKSVLEGGENHEKFIGWLDMVADFISSLKAKDGKKIAVIFRPWHEHMGSWFWWGQNLCTAEEYQALWVMTISRLKEKGADNIVVAYSPNLELDESSYMKRYPGDEWVDLLGLDTYHIGGEAASETFIKGLDFALNQMTELGKKHNKLIAVTEIGSEAIPMPNWWTTVLFSTIEKYPVCYVLLWRNAYDRENHYYAPYPGHASVNDFMKFYELPRTIFVKDMAKL